VILSLDDRGLYNVNSYRVDDENCDCGKAHLPRN